MPDSPPISKLLSWREVRALVPLSRATVWSLRRRGAFPRPIQLSPNRIAWRETDLDAWISARCGINAETAGRSTRPRRSPQYDEGRG